MSWLAEHFERPDSSFDGGDLDCGSGLLLLIRKQLDLLQPGQLLEIRSTESSVDEDLPAWCRLTRNELVSQVSRAGMRSFLVRKAGVAKLSEGSLRAPASDRQPPTREPQIPRTIPVIGPLTGERSARRAPLAFAPLAVMGIGSWPRPRWLMRDLHEYLEGRLPEDEFQRTADDAVRLAIVAQERADVDVVTDGEQRRDNYASFVGSRLEHCQLVPLTDLLPYVDDPEKFERDLHALDVPAAKVRHPVMLGPIRRHRPLAVHELRFAQSITSKLVKVALPGPYLLSRILWVDCFAEKPYPSRELFHDDLVAILRAEITELLDAGAAIVQLDEPVLTEVAFNRPTKDRSFMCGALAERRAHQEELALAVSLLQRVLAGFPRERLALHVCRGNWSKDERVLTGDYRPLLPVFHAVPVGIFFLELCTPRAGEMEVLADLPRDCRIGVGVVNQKLDRVEPPEEIAARMRRAIDVFGAERVLFNPDCGFATFADNPVTEGAIAESKLRSIVAAVRIVRAPM